MNDYQLSFMIRTLLFLLFFQFTSFLWAILLYMICDYVFELVLKYVFHLHRLELGQDTLTYKMNANIMAFLVTSKMVNLTDIKI